MANHNPENGNKRKPIHAARVFQQRKIPAPRTAVQKATACPKYNDQLYTLTSREE